MIRMTSIRVEGVGVLRSFFLIFHPSFLASFVSPSFLPLFLSSLAFLPSFRGSPFVPSYLPCFLFFSFLPSFLSPAFLPSFLAGFSFRSFLSFFLPFLLPFFSVLPSFLPFSRHSFLPCLRRDPPQQKRKGQTKRTEKNTPSFQYLDTDSKQQTRCDQGATDQRTRDHGPGDRREHGTNEPEPMDQRPRDQKIKEPEDRGTRDHGTRNQGTRGPRDQRTRDHGTKGPGDQRTAGLAKPSKIQPWPNLLKKTDPDISYNQKPDNSFPCWVSDTGHKLL